MKFVTRALQGTFPWALHWARSLRAVVRARRSGADPFLWFAAPGHYYSPLPDMGGAERALAALPEAGPGVGLPDVDLRDEVQRAWWRRLSGQFARLGLGQADGRPRLYPGDNVFFGLGDAHVAGAMLLAAPPTRVIEVGSGYSSALLLDAAARIEERRIEFTFIDPDLSRLEGLIGAERLRRHRVIRGLVQEQRLALFESLEAGDWLFIDSSHVAKIGSDVLFLLFEVLPRVKPGVLVHIHDIFWPFEYPESWYREGRAWNEAYLVRALLARGGTWGIRFWNDWFWRAHRAEVATALPGVTSLGASLWLERVGA